MEKVQSVFSGILHAQMERRIAGFSAILPIVVLLQHIDSISFKIRKRSTSSEDSLPYLSIYAVRFKRKINTL